MFFSFPSLADCLFESLLVGSTFLKHFRCTRTGTRQQNLNQVVQLLRSGMLRNVLYGWGKSCVNLQHNVEINLVTNQCPSWANSFTYFVFAFRLHHMLDLDMSTVVCTSTRRSLDAHPTSKMIRSVAACLASFRTTCHKRTTLVQSNITLWIRAFSKV